MSGYIGGLLILAGWFFLGVFLQSEIKEQDNNIKRHDKNAFCNE